MLQRNRLLLCGSFMLSFFLTTLNGQSNFYAKETFTRADTLRGMLRPERTCYDVHYYDLSVDVFPDEQRIEGHVEVHFNALTDFERLQIDLFDNMNLSAIKFEGNKLAFERMDNAIFIQFPRQTKLITVAPTTSVALWPPNIYLFFWGGIKNQLFC